MSDKEKKSTDQPPKVSPKDEGGGMLPKMELLIILVFFASFLVWAMSKCSSTQEVYEQRAAKKIEKTVEKEVPKKKDEIVKKEKVAAKKSPPTKASPEKVTILYVVLDGLKLRKSPHLDSTIIKTLKEGKEVYFLNQVTDFTQDINLGDRIAKEPWIKVRAYSGHEGWVYGAGVNYFKPKKTPPVIATDPAEVPEN